MKNKLVIILTLIFIGIPIFSESKRNISLEWSSINNATGYRLQVRNKQKEIIIDKILKSPRAEISLLPEQYERRVGVLDSRKDVAVWSEWNSFQVVVLKTPKVEPGQEILTKETGVLRKLTLRGNDFAPDMEIKLEGSLGTELPIQKINIINQQTVYLEFKIPNRTEEKFHLVLENPGNKVNRVEKFLVIAKDEKSVTEKTEKGDNTEGLTEEKTTPPKPEWMVPYRLKVLARSSVLPGWGQNYRGDKYGWYVYLLPILAAGAIYGNEYMNTIRSINSYQKVNKLSFVSFQVLPIPRSELTSFYAFRTYQNGIDTAKQVFTHRRNGSYALGAISLFYLVNLLDAYFLTPKEDPFQNKTGWFIDRQINALNSFTNNRYDVHSYSEYRIGYTWNW